MVQQIATPPEVEGIVSRVCADLAALIEVLGGARSAPAEVIASVESAGRLMDAARILAAVPLATDPGVAAKLGFASPISAVASIAQVSEQTARARVAIARSTAPSVSISGAPLPPAHPNLAAALVSGGVGVDAAVLVTRQLDSVAPRLHPEILAVAERVMVNIVTGLDPSGEHTVGPASVDCLATEIKQFSAAIDPDGARPREERAARRRQFRIGCEDEDGLFPISGRLKRELALLIKAAMEAYRRSPRFVDGERGIDAEGVPGFSDSRTPEQWAHDVLGEIIAAALSQPSAPNLDGVPVTVVVMVEESDLANPDGLVGDPIGTMAGSNLPVSRSQVERFIDGNGSRKVIKNSDGAVTGIGLPARCFSYPQRLATAARDGYKCSTPGCTSPHYTLQMHHVIPDRENGPTAVDNAILLCYWCHSRVDDGPWQWRMVGGLPEVRGPGYSEWTRLRPAAVKAV